MYQLYISQRSEQLRLIADTNFAYAFSRPHIANISSTIRIELAGVRFHSVLVCVLSIRAMQEGELGDIERA